ncbi:MAG: hypothetical protein WCC87_19310 [Candidatus Korobacteraceae bacterium]|jgi:hypothetical protein
MTVTLELKPEIEAGLVAQAHARGLSLEAYLEQVLQSAVAPNRPEERKSLAQLFADSPFKGLNLNFERDTDTGRPVKL